MRAKILRAKNFVLDLIFPVFCCGCGTEGSFLCPVCRLKIREAPPTCFVCGKLDFSIGGGISGRTCRSCRPKTNVYGFISPFVYEDKLIRQLIHDFKYRGIKDIGSLLSAWLHEYLLKYKLFMSSDWVLLPIPLHRKRKIARGFNQSEIIAKNLSNKFKLVYNPKILFKNKNTIPQMELGGEERKINLKGVFEVRNPSFIQNRIVLLIDDVKTTGSTLEEAAQTLKSTGAKRVWAITVAH